MVGDVDNGGRYTCLREGFYETSVLSSQFCCEPKTALKYKFLKNDRANLTLISYWLE